MYIFLHITANSDNYFLHYKVRIIAWTIGAVFMLNGCLSPTQRVLRHCSRVDLSSRTETCTLILVPCRTETVFLWDTSKQLEMVMGVVFTLYMRCFSHMGSRGPGVQSKDPLKSRCCAGLDLDCFFGIHQSS